VGAYLVRRALLLAPTLFGISAVTFALIRMIPGDLVTVLLGITASQSPSTRAAIVQALHLDRPLAVQYLLWVRGLAGGDFGRSLVSGFSVRAELLRSLPVTLELAAMTMGLALAAGVPLGVLAALQSGRIADVLVRTGALLFISAPAFFVGTLLVIAASRYAPWLPLLQFVPFSADPAANLLSVLPAAAALGAAIAAILLRFTRSSLLEVLRHDYVRTARAKGAGARRIVFRHALRNAAIPVVAVAGTHAVYLLGGVVVIEEVFALPGMGRLVVNAIYQRDYTTIQGAVLVLTVIAVLVTLLLDVLYALFDPRLRYD
jgi:peptide/nickel transport system permease protein